MKAIYMKKKSSVTKIGLITAGITLTGLSLPLSDDNIPEQTHEDTKVINTAITVKPQKSPKTEVKFTKRTPKKVYHRFEEVPTLTDEEAIHYNKDEYTYIANADAYQKYGKLILKRVLKKEITSVNTLSLIYRSECQTYIPQKNEDQLAKYVIDLRLMNSTASVKGPSQMDDDAIKNFIKYLVANRETRKYALPLVKARKGDIQTAANKLGHAFFDNENELKNMNERDAVIHSPIYSNIVLKEDAWQTIASPQLKKFIALKEKKLSEKFGKEKTLTNTTKNYLCLTELFPNEELLQKHLEDYNLGFYQLGRPGKTKHIMDALAQNMNLKNAKGQYDSTRLPTYVIAASISHINWQGNGLTALKSARELKSVLQSAPQNQKEILKAASKSWVTGKSKKYGVEELSQLNILTPNIIHQYTILEIPGAFQLYLQYKKNVVNAENNLPDEKVANLDKADTLVLSAMAFNKSR